MIMVNIISLVTLTHLFAADMAAKGGGRILNVGSTAGFMPVSKVCCSVSFSQDSELGQTLTLFLCFEKGPNQAVYFATKAFVNSFSQAVDQELRDQGVHSTVLAPGYVETEFAQVANLEGTSMIEGGGASAESVAKCGYDAMMAEKLVVINETKLSILLQWVIPFLPRRMVLKMASDMQEK